MSSFPPDPPDEITEALRIPLTPPSATPTSPIAHATVNITLGNLAIKTKVPIPTGNTSLQHLLPILRAFTQAIVHAATEQNLPASQTISCKNHCGACCRKLVPLSAPEAHILATLVSTLPEPRRSEITSRFIAAKQKLATANLLEPLTRFSSLPQERANTLSTEYFQQQIPCPFLENESCSIYNDRPLLCREYLVTSDPVLCADPHAQVIALKLSAYVSQALTLSANSPVIPLTLALDWSAAHPEPAPTLPGPKLLHQLLTHLSQTATHAQTNT